MTKTWYEVSCTGNGFVVKSYEITRREKLFTGESREFTTREAAEQLLLFKVKLLISRK